ncbi:MAG: Dps family protein [Actinomycetota bacterium]
MSDYTVPGLSQQDTDELQALLAERLASLLDLSLTLKHVHWNVHGEGFIAVHRMLDPQVDSVRKMVDETAERIATLGGSPQGTPQAIVDRRTWADYSLGKASVRDHLEQLDKAYAGVIQDHRKAQERSATLDPVTEDMLLGHLADLELYQWFVRAHLEEPGS